MAEQQGNDPKEDPKASAPAPQRKEVVRRRRPGYKLVNGGWVRDRSKAR